MILKSIEMSNFRNYEREEFHFHEGTNVLYGDNAQGKTNVLEAIYLGGTTKSHKGSKDSDMIMKGKDEAHIRYYVEKKRVLIKSKFTCVGERQRELRLTAADWKQ